MLSQSRWIRFLVLSVCCGFTIAGADAAPTLQTVQIAGYAHMRSEPEGLEGQPSVAFVPTFTSVPDLRDEPAAAGASKDAIAPGTFSKRARERLINRSIARRRGRGESIFGEDGPREERRLTGFDGLSFSDQQLANNGNRIAFEPPDQGLCVGNGFVLESVNDVSRVFDREGQPLTGVVDLNTFHGYPPPIDHNTGRFGPQLSDPSCYYDPQTRRFFHLVHAVDVDPATGVPTGPNHLDLAVSSTADPRDVWVIYRIAVQNDGTGSTPANANCPCVGDFPHIGADRYGIYLTTNEFTLRGDFNAAQIYAVSKRELADGASNLSLVHIDTKDHLLEGHPGFALWPAVSPAGDFAIANRGTAYFLSSEAVFSETGNADRLRIWALGNTRSLETSSPDVTLVQSTVQVRSYGVPPASTQKAGPAPLGECINDRTLATPTGVGCWRNLFADAVEPPPQALLPESMDSGDSRMQQVLYIGGRLYGALGTAVNVQGEERAGIAYYAIRPFAQHGSVIGIVEHEGQIGMAQHSLSFPAIAALPSGRGVIAFTLTGTDHFPSAAYIHLGANGHEGHIRLAARGGGPEDGFSGYEAYPSGARSARWGDYGAAAVDGDEIWFASEYIGQTCSLAAYVAAPFGSCGGTRTALGNWATRISRIRP
ncbi:hypothetical protein [Variovorax sp. GT1P44]|uniref:hypothetical protein n=1 Tax=Variovorax sp. GT1P44 TaxID=3443742 RepID=UPI003F471664